MKNICKHDKERKYISLSKSVIQCWFSILTLFEHLIEISVFKGCVYSDQIQRNTFKNANSFPFHLDFAILGINIGKNVVLETLSVCMTRYHKDKKNYRRNSGGTLQQKEKMIRETLEVRSVKRRREEKKEKKKREEREEGEERE